MAPRNDPVMLALELALGQAAASSRLRAALLAGADTTAIRAELADLDRQVESLATEQAAATAAAETKTAKRIDATAAGLAADVTARLDALLNTLKPPAAPQRQAALRPSPFS
jgi:DNA-binding protein H-NS